MENINIKRDDVIRWIHSVEYGKPVRMAGLVTELYFSKKLHDAHSKGQFSCIAEGWFYVTHFEHGKALRHWCRVTDPDSFTLSRVELAFIESLSPLGHRFFFLQWDIHVEEGRAKFKPEITITAKEWLTDNGIATCVKSPESHILETRINRELRTYISTISFGLKEGWNVDLPFLDWFRSVDDNALMELFVQRCLMNSSIKLKPLDLDAMALDGVTGALVFLEFKRKYPTRGGRRPKVEMDRPLNYFSFMTEMQQVLRSSNIRIKKDMISRFDSECDKRNFSYRGIPSFGLDLHHFETMIFCERRGIEYRYVIWNARAKDREPSSKKLSEQDRALEQLNVVLSELEDLLSPTLVPHVDPKWWVRTLDSTDVKGLTFTFGDDSGSYSKEIRLQVIFDEK